MFDFPGAIGTRRLSLLAERDMIVVVLVVERLVF